LAQHNTPLSTCNAPASSAISTLSLHDALPILQCPVLQTSIIVELDIVPKLIVQLLRNFVPSYDFRSLQQLLTNHHSHLKTLELVDRKSTRLNSSHVSISYAVFCLKNNGMMQLI